MGWAILIHIILIIITIVEVFVYSVLINPGQEQAVYDHHAEISGPWISMIFGFLLFLLTTRILGTGRAGKEFTIALFLTLFYVVTDALILIAAGVDWNEHFVVFLVSFLVKTAGAVIGALMAKRRNTNTV